MPSTLSPNAPRHIVADRLPEGLAVAILTAVSPYLWLPVRTLAQVKADREVRHVAS